MLAKGYDLIRGPDGALVTWSAGPIPIQLRLSQATTFQDGTNHTTSVAAALAAWNEHLAAVQFAPDAQPSGTAGSFNGLNEVTFEPSIYSAEPSPVAFGPNVLAVTLSYRSSLPREDGTYVRTESDVIFNTGAPGGWDSYRGNLQSAQDIRRVAIHEFGHVLGLGHPDQNGQTVYTIMNSTVSFIDSLQPDDLNGAQFQYGRPGGFAVPANDSFANAAALVLNGTSIVLQAESIGASREAGEPQHAPGEAGGASVWWRWTANAGGTLLINTTGSLFDTMLAAYTGTSLAGLTQLAANDDVQAGIIRTSSVSFPVVYGTTYHLAVDGWAGEWGAIKLSVSLVDVINPPFIITEPANRTISVGESTSMTVSASGATVLEYRWQVSAGGTGPWTDLSDDALHSGTATAELVIPAATTNVRDGNSYRCRVRNAGGQAVSGSANLTVARLTQSIDFPPLANRGYTPVPFALEAGASSGLPVAFALVSGPATLLGNQLTLTGTGTVILQATQGGDATYVAAAPVERSFAVAKGTATVTLSGLAKTYDGEPQTVNVSTTPSGLEVALTYDGTPTAPTAAGNYAVEATVHDALYDGAAGGTLVIAPAAQTIQFVGPADRSFTTDPIALHATSSSGLPVSFTVSAGPARVEEAMLLLDGAGNVTVRASQAGNANYEAAPPVERTFLVTGNYESWTLENFSAEELSAPSISGPGADPDGDGLANLLEYALGLAPRVASVSGLPVVSRTATHWTFTYTRPAARDDVDYVVESSSDLAAWDSGNVTHIRVAEGAVETWQATVPMSGIANLFFRLRVTR